MRKGTIALVATVTIVALALSGCGATPAPQIVEKVVTQEVVVKETVIVPVVQTQVVKETVLAPTATPVPKINMSFWFYDYEPQYAFQQQKVDEYMALYPNVVIDYDHTFAPVGEGGYEDKITTALATGTAPDLFFIFNAQAPKFIPRGLLAPITDEAAKLMGYESVADLKAKKLPGAFDAFSDAQGTPYALHEQLTFLTFFVNGAHMRAAGFDPATTKMETWDDVLTVGRQVVAANPNGFYKDANGNWQHNFLKLPIYVDDSWASWILTAFLAQSGGTVLNKEGTAAAINSPEAVKAVEVMKALSTELGDPRIGGVIPGEQFADFGAGNLSASLSGNWFYPNWIKGQPVEHDWYMYKIPRIYPDKPGNVFWSLAAVVNAKSPNINEAWKFIGFMFKDPNQLTCTLGTWQPIPNYSEQWGPQCLPFTKEIEASAEGGVFAMPIHEDAPEINRVVRGKLESIMYEGADVQEALDAAAAEINDILKK